MSPDPWRDALCRKVADPEIFFSHDADDQKEAKAACGTCPLADACLEYALDHEEKSRYYRAGIFGGVTANARARMASNVTLPCAICQTLIRDPQPNQRYCSQSCAITARRRKSRAYEQKKQRTWVRKRVAACVACQTPVTREGGMCVPCNAQRGNAARSVARQAAA